MIRQLPLFCLLCFVSAVGCEDASGNAPTSDAGSVDSAANSNDAGSADAASRADTASGDAAPRGSDSSTTIPTPTNAKSYDFSGSDDLVTAALGTYKLDCVAATGKAEVGVGYWVIEKPFVLKYLNGAGEAIVVADGADGIADGANAVGPLYMIFVNDKVAKTDISGSLFKNGDIDLVARDQNTGTSVRCMHRPTRILRYGAKVPDELVALAGTHVLKNVTGAKEFELVITADGAITSKQIKGPGASDDVLYSGGWGLFKFPEFSVDNTSGDFILYKVDSKTDWTLQLGIPGSGAIPGFDMQVIKGPKIKRVQHKGVIMVAK